MVSDSAEHPADLPLDMFVVAGMIKDEPGKALALLEQSLVRDPTSLDALRLAAEASMRLGHPDEALDHLNLALHYYPGDLESIKAKVRALVSNHEEALARKLLSDQFSADPKNVDVGLLLARAHYEAWNYVAARETLENLRDSAPSNFEVLNFLGLILAREFGELKRGQELVARALEVRPDALSAMSNLGWILAERGLLSDAEEYFDRVLAITPDDGETRLMRACALLKSGRFAEGWQDFEARFHSQTNRKTECSLPELTVGMEVSGKRVFLISEQGLGDQIMFSSCVPDLMRESDGCVIQCDDRLVPIFSRSFVGADVLGDQIPAARRDQVLVQQKVSHRIAMGSLPLRYRQSLSDFPEHQGFLHADSLKVIDWKRRLAELGASPKIGISWRGGAMSTRRQLRSVDPELLVSSISAAGQLVSLQYGLNAEEVGHIDSLKVANRRVIHWPDAIDDYEDTAALIMALDVVVSVCTAVVHLAGAMGKEVWVLVPAVPEWRYLATGNDMPWYPSARLYRQASGEPWEAVMGRLTDDLMQRMNKGR
jgi:Tfp pilus assembly protein PilF